MARKPGFHIGLVLILLFLMTACSGGGDPVTGSFSVGDTGLSSQRTSNVSSNRMLWGYYNCVIDIPSSTVEIIPARGAMMHVNAVEWMQPPAGSVANLQVLIVDESQWFSEGRLDLDVILNHPFTGLDQFTGFDVMGVFMTDGHQPLLSQSGVWYSDGGTQDATMLNPDGYTRWWNQDEFDDPSIRIFSYLPGKVAVNGAGLDAQINPYKYFTEGIGATDDEGPWLENNPDLRGYFPAGTAITRRYDLKWPVVAGVPQLAFDYAIVASWEPPATTPPVNIPGDFPITANALEPVAISVTNNSDIFYDTVNDIVGGSVALDIEVYGWQVPIDQTIERLIVEFPISSIFPAGATYIDTPGTWTVSDGGINSSVWEVDITTLDPMDLGTTPLMIILETSYNYDNGYGTKYPFGEPLSSYFVYEIEVYGAPGVPVCNEVTSEFLDRTYIEVENYMVDVSVPGGNEYFVDWSVVPYGDPEVWTTLPDQPAEEIILNWYAVTNDGVDLGSYEVCASVYNTEGFSECCLSVIVDDLMNIGPVTGQNGIILSQQPNQGAQPCDLTVWDTGSGSFGQLMYQDDGMVPPAVRMYRFNDNYSSIVGTPTLDATGPPPLDEASTWNDYHKFDVAPTGGIIQLASGNPTFPSIIDPGTYNINDPFHSWILAYWNMTGVNIMLGLFGDVGYSPTPPSPPDPDNVPWKHIPDWTSGAAFYNTRMYGLMTVSEEWIPEHPGYTHPGTIWALVAEAPYDNIVDDYEAVSLGLSTQDPGGGEVDDTTPDYMAIAVDDNMPVQLDWSSSPDDLMDDVVVWYFLSSESTGSARKVHIVLLPEDLTIDFDIFYYEDFIGAGSPWGADFSGATPVDIETIYSNREDLPIDHNYNWLAVLLDTGTGWRVDVFRYDPLFGSVALVDTYDPGVTGTPTALDIDTLEHEIHVFYDDGSQYRVTVLEFT